MTDAASAPQVPQALPSPPPEQLRERGAALWRDYVGRYAFELTELVTLTMAAEQADDIDRLDAIVANAETPREARLALSEQRACRHALVQLLGQLALPSDDDERPMTARQRQASQAASIRWQRARARRGEV